jgi:hypothetical protein
VSRRSVFILEAMENILLALLIANMVAVLLLYMELKSTQERISAVQNGISRLVNAAVESAIKERGGNPDQIPLLQQRVERLTNDMFDLKETVKVGAAAKAAQTNR